MQIAAVAASRDLSFSWLTWFVRVRHREYHAVPLEPQYPATDQRLPQLRTRGAGDVE